MLVAWRVKEWTEPLLYRVIPVCRRRTPRQIAGFPIFTEDIILRVIATKPPEFLQNAVKHLVFDCDTPAVDAILTACPRVTNIFENSHLRFAAPRRLGHLRRLTISVEAFLQCYDVSLCLANLTHLGLLYRGLTPDVDLCTVLALIPRLTHISLAAQHTPMLYTALHEDTRLHCIVLLWDVEKTHAIMDDERLVCIHHINNLCRDWLRGAHTGDDYWALAESFLAEKRAGKVDRAQYTISATDPW
ncbi:hypothetical protein B0H13DRAFT_2513490 [Mycena leptocephala]|nr:hypothetical protein B0H13DRAFT_2513490 [Mycena leptocephala]